MSSVSITSVSITVVRPGPLTTIQDLGRPGFAAIGVSGSGAADRAAMAMANALVGNPSAAAGLEMTFGGLRMRITQDVSVAVTGAPLPIRVLGMDGQKIDKPWGEMFMVAAGEQLDFGRPARGLRSYVAVAGGIDVPPILGSRSTDTLSGLGPPPLTAGTELPIGPAVRQGPGSSKSVLHSPQDDRPDGVLRVRLGPREDWFTPAGVESLLAQQWTVTPDSNRIGMKLTGDPLDRHRHDELPSEGVLPGAIQIPPSGLPVIFLADHPVTGGYPVIGVVVRADIDLAAQIRPGGTIRFRLVNL